MECKGLAAFSLLLTLLQVRGQINCYSDEICGGSGGSPVEYSSVFECCQQDNPSVVRSYVPVGGSTPCQPCIEVAFSFDRPVYVVMENQIQAVLVITKNGTSGNSHSVRLTGSIENGSDITQDLVFSPGQISIQVPVPLVDDAIALEEPTQYLFSLQIPTGQTGVELGGHPNCTLVVEDDDVVVIGFEQIIYNVIEEHHFVDIAFRINNYVTISSSSDPVEVQLQILEGSATEPSDYFCGPTTTYTFTATDTQFTVSCVITDDTVFEDFELFMVRLTALTPYVILSPNDAVVGIIDDDEPESALFQLKGKGFSLCTESDSSAESSVESLIRLQVSNVIREMCHCNFQESYIDQAVLLGEKEQPDEVVYRARIFRYANYSASHLVGFIEEWVEQGASISNGIFLQVTFDSDCPVRISNIDEPICVQQPNVAITLTLTSTSSPLISKTSSLPVSVLTSILTINPTSTGAAQSWDKLALSAIIASAILAVIVSVLITVVIVLLVHLRTQKKEVSDKPTQYGEEHQEEIEMKECAAYNETRQSHVPPAAPTQEHLSVIYEFCDGGSVYEKIPGES